MRVKDIFIAGAAFELLAVAGGLIWASNRVEQDHQHAMATMSAEQTSWRVTETAWMREWLTGTPTPIPMQTPDK